MVCSENVVVVSAVNLYDTLAMDKDKPGNVTKPRLALPVKAPPNVPGPPEAVKETVSAACGPAVTISPVALRMENVGAVARALLGSTLPTGCVSTTRCVASS